MIPAPAEFVARELFALATSFEVKACVAVLDDEDDAARELFGKAAALYRRCGAVEAAERAEARAAE